MKINITSILLLISFVSNCFLYAQTPTLSHDFWEKVGQMPVISKKIGTHSELRGYDWIEVKDTTIISIFNVSANANNVILGYVAHAVDKFLFRSLDGGKTWQDISSNVPAPKEVPNVPGYKELIDKARSTVNSLFAFGEDFYIQIGDGQFIGNFLLRSKDAGKTWELLSEVSLWSQFYVYKNELYLYEKFADISNSTFLGSNKLIVKKSPDGGKTWSTIFNGRDTVAYVREGRERNIDSRFGEHYFKYSNESKWYRNYEFKKLNNPGNSSVYESRVGYIYKGAHDKPGYTLVHPEVPRLSFTLTPQLPKELFDLCKSSNDGKHWNITSKVTLIKNDWIHLVDCNNVIYATLSGPVNGFCRSKDDGRSWELLSGLPRKPLPGSIHQAPDGRLYYIVDDILYRSREKLCIGTENPEQEPEYGTTIITHGYQLPGSSAPIGKDQWAYEMAKAILEKAQNGAIYRYKKDTGVYEEVENIGDVKKGEKILLFDWASESSNLGQGYSEAAGDALFASLIMGYKKGQFELDSIHFIGHSRGTVVNTEVIERLLALKNNFTEYANKISIDQVTNLDPHDWGALSASIVKDHDNHPNINISCPDNETPNNGTISWIGSGFNDSYFQVGNPIISGNPLDGRMVEGTYNVDWSKLAPGHSAIHERYLESIKGYENIFSDGYKYSKILNGNTLRKNEPGAGCRINRQSPEFNYYNPMVVKSSNSIRIRGIMNGSFDRVSSSTAPGWSNGIIYKPGDLERNIEILSFSPSGAKFQISKDFSKVTLGHDRLYIPKDAISIRFLVKAANVKNGVIIVTLKDCLSNKSFPQTITIPSDITDFKEYTIGLTGIQDKVITLTFEFKSDVVDNDHLPQLIIDEVKLSKQTTLSIQPSTIKNANEDNKQLTNNQIGINPSPNKITQDNIQEDLPTIEYDQLAFQTYPNTEYAKLKSTPYFENNAQNFATEVVFSNYSNETVKTYFIDFEGNKLPYSSIPPNSMVIQPTYINHIWMLTDKDEKCILVITPKTRAKQEIKIKSLKSTTDVQWQPLSMPNSGKKIFCDNGKAWVIGMDDRIYFQSGNEWKEYPGEGIAQDIAVFNNVPYVIGSDGYIYKGTGNGWTQFGGYGSGKNIFCDKGIIWVVGSDDAIYSFKGGSWSQYPGNGQARDIAVNNGVPYVIGMDNAIYAGTGSGWKKVSGKEGKRIFYEKEKIWIIGLDDNIYYHNGKNWILYPGNGKGIDISVYNGVPYVVGMDNAVYKGK